MSDARMGAKPDQTRRPAAYAVYFTMRAREEKAASLTAQDPLRTPVGVRQRRQNLGRHAPRTRQNTCPSASDAARWTARVPL